MNVKERITIFELSFINNYRWLEEQFENFSRTSTIDSFLWQDDRAVSTVAPLYFGRWGSFLAATGRQIIGITGWKPSGWDAIPSAICLSRAGSVASRRATRVVKISPHLLAVPNLPPIPPGLAILSRERHSTSRCEHKRPVMIASASLAGWRRKGQGRVERGCKSFSPTN